MGKTKDNRDLIITKFLTDTTKPYNQIALELNFVPSTVSRVIRRFRETQTTERKRAGGRNLGNTQPKLASKVVDYVRQNPNSTERELAQKFKISKTWVNKVLRSSGLNAYKIQKSANRNDQQAARAKTRARRLYDQYLRGKNQCIVMDDETYCVADFKQLPGRGFYRARKRFGVARQFKYQCLTKYPKKYMAWQAVCSCGRKSKTFVARGNMKTAVYIKECLQKRLLPFLRSHNIPTLFWPDLASIHYAKAALEWYEENDVTVVPIEANPPNCPHLRPVEKYWAQIKQKLRKSGKVAKNYASFARFWLGASNKVTEPVVKKLMHGLPGKVHRFSREALED